MTNYKFLCPVCLTSPILDIAQKLEPHESHRKLNFRNVSRVSKRWYTLANDSRTSLSLTGFKVSLQSLLRGSMCTCYLPAATSSQPMSTSIAWIKNDATNFFETVPLAPPPDIALLPHRTVFRPRRWRPFSGDSGIWRSSISAFCSTAPTKCWSWSAACAET